MRGFLCKILDSSCIPKSSPTRPLAPRRFADSTGCICCGTSEATASIIQIDLCIPVRGKSSRQAKCRTLNHRLGGSGETISYCVNDAARRVCQEDKIGPTRYELDAWTKRLSQPLMTDMGNDSYPMDLRSLAWRVRQKGAIHRLADSLTELPPIYAAMAAFL